jgi:two-component system CheB/CheR fusion protein
MPKKNVSLKTDTRKKSAAAPAPTPGAAPADPVLNDDPLAFPIVGIVAGAGGGNAADRLLAALPASSTMAFVLLSADPQSASADRHFPLPVLPVVGKILLERGKAYRVPHEYIARFSNGHITAVKPGAGASFGFADAFLQELAQYAQDQAIAVILGGETTDGIQGIQEIKAASGITLAQDPREARPDTLPRAAVAADGIDIIAPLAGLPTELAALAHGDIALGHGKSRRPPSEQFARVFSILRSATGVDFSHYKLPTIRRRMHRRMLLRRIDNLEAYIAFLQQNPKEVEALYHDILIHVTRFFRDADSFEALRESVIPRIIDSRHGGSPIRIWVPGCSTGEEAYSVAIVMLEFLGDDVVSRPFQVFATDISHDAVELGRAGVYKESIAADVSPERLRRFFTRTDGGYRIAKTVRDTCVFARQDLVRDPPFSKLDLILCRNVLIYLDLALQRKLMSTFHYALKPLGFLMLGNAETIGPQSDLFLVVDKKHKLYAKRITDQRDDLAFRTDGSPTHVHEPARRAGPRERAPSTVQHVTDRLLLQRYSPPGVIIDGDLKIIHFHGQTGKFLEPAPGDASLNILKMAREGLLYGLRAAISEARKKRAVARKEGLHVKTNGGFSTVNIEVLPVISTDDASHFLVTFQQTAEDHSPAPKSPRGKAGSRAKRPPADRATRLQAELEASREYLQSIIHDLEASNEELQSAHEELLSANEELQSTNEELDTAKEELQSTNEELNTVNEELHARNEELSRMNSDVVNLLGSVQIAIVMVTSDLRIRRFTPAAEKVLNLIPTDIGRPISDIKPNVNVPDLEKLIADVIDSVTTRECEVHDRTNAAYTLRIRPYKNADHRIDGAVLSLVDIDAQRREAHDDAVIAEAAGNLLKQAVAAVSEPIAVIAADGHIIAANTPFIHEVSPGPLDKPFRDAITRAIADGTIRHPLPGAKRVAILHRLDSERITRTPAVAVTLRDL